VIAVYQMAHPGNSERNPLTTADGEEEWDSTVQCGIVNE
jgi:hypothetical protein